MKGGELAGLEQCHEHVRRRDPGGPDPGDTRPLETRLAVIADVQARADARFEAALAESGARDPREYYRERLRELKGSDEAAYDRAVTYYHETLIPTVASADSDPLAAWREYGRFIAELTAPGRTVEVDASGRSHTYRPPVAPDRMVLHLPERRGARALLIGLPAEPSPAQMATYDLLVRGKQKLRRR